jgi:transposase-like protein
MIGRGMRQGGEMLLLDHTDNWQTHGLPSHDYVFTLHPEDGKTCASTSKERTQLDRGEDGEVFDTGRPIVDYRLVEIERLQSKKALAQILVNDGILTKTQIAKNVGASVERIKAWFPEYRLKKDLPSYAGARQKALRLVNEGLLNKEQIAKEVGVSHSIIHKWFPEYRSGKKTKLKKLVEDNIYSVKSLALMTGVSAAEVRRQYPDYEDRFYGNTTALIKNYSSNLLPVEEIAKLTGTSKAFVRQTLPGYAKKLNEARLEKASDSLRSLSLEINNLYLQTSAQLDSGIPISQVIKDLGVTERMIASWFPEYRSRSTK